MNVSKYYDPSSCVCVFNVELCVVVFFLHVMLFFFLFVWQVKKLFQVQFVDYTAVETDIVGKRRHVQAKPGVMAFMNVQIKEEFLVGISL